MASFSDLVRAQRQSGRGVVTSLSGAYNQMNMQRYDPRNALFSKGGIMTSLFPGLKGYQASPVSSKSPSSMISPEISGSPTALNSIARDARISARNSMALPSIARNMSQMVRIWGGTPAKYFEKAKAKEEAYEAKQSGGKRGFAGLGKSAGGKGLNIMGGLGGALGGIGSVLGSVVGGVGSVIGSILGGFGSLLGGAASGIFGILSSALGGMGMFGVILAAASGFVLYQIFKNADFSSLGKGISGTLESIQGALSGIFNDVDDMSGNKLSKFINDIKAQFKEVTIRVSSAIEVATEALMKLGGAVIKDFGGYFQNFFQENKGKIYALMALGIMGPRALLTLPGAAITAIAAAVGAATSEKSTEQLKQDLFDAETDVLRSKERLRKGEEEKQPEYKLANFRQALKVAEEKRDSLRSQIEEKEGRTTNFNKEISQFSIENLKSQQDARVAEKMAAATGASTAPSPAGPLSGANLLDMIGAKEGGKMGYDAANKGKAGDMPQGYPGLSKLKVSQVMALQAKGEIKAAGKYQFMPSTLAGLVAGKYGNKPVNPDAIFDATLQDALGMALINWRIKRGGNDPIRQQFELSQEFAAIENPYSGKSSYEGIAGNKSTISTNQMQTALRGGNIGGSGSQMASTPPPAPVRTAGSQPPKPSAADSAAAFAADQIMALDKMMGGQLLKGSSQLADMLRDITREFMNNPTFVDNSQTVNNGQPGLTAATTGGGYSVMNPDAVALMVDKTSYHYAPYRS
jgi:hypothetical protein